MDTGQKTDQQKGPENQKTPRPQADKGDNCRCKETAAMKPRELLKLMLHDLAFWKKEKR